MRRENVCNLNHLLRGALDTELLDSTELDRRLLGLRRLCERELECESESLSDELPLSDSEPESESDSELEPELEEPEDLRDDIVQLSASTKL